MKQLRPKKMKQPMKVNRKWRMKQLRMSCKRKTSNTIRYLKAMFPSAKPKKTAKGKAKIALKVFASMWAL